MASGTTALIFGNDDYLVGAKSREIVDALVPPDQRAFGLDSVDGAADTVDAAVNSISLCMEALQTVGFMASSKVVWFRDVSFLSDTVVGRSETVKDKLAELAGLIKSGLPEGVRLVVAAPRVDKRYAFYKACRDAGELHEFNVPERAQQAERRALDFVAAHLEGQGLTMSVNDMRFFVERVGSDTQQLVMETEKLLLFLGARKHVVRKDIEHVCAAAHDALLWDLTDAVGERDLPKALRVARDLMFQKQNVIGILCVVETRIRDLMIYREALNRKWLVPAGGGGGKGSSMAWAELPPETNAMFVEAFSPDPRSIHPYRVSVMADQARRYSMRELGRCLSAAVQAHEALVSSRVPPHIVLDTLLVTMLRTHRKVDSPKKRTLPAVSFSVPSRACCGCPQGGAAQGRS